MEFQALRFVRGSLSDETQELNQQRPRFYHLQYVPEKPIVVDTEQKADEQLAPRIIAVVLGDLIN